MVILVDSREQNPYTFDCPTEVIGLSVGDYSIKGLENYISIEKKELNDLIACLSKDRPRFERELYKGKSLEYMALVIEGSLSDIVNHNYKSEMQPKAAIQSLLAFSIRYRLPIFFCESREYGQRVTESLLLKYGREVEKQFKSITEKGS